MEGYVETLPVAHSCAKQALLVRILRKLNHSKYNIKLIKQ